MKTLRPSWPKPAVSVQESQASSLNPLGSQGLDPVCDVGVGHVLPVVQPPNVGALACQVIVVHEPDVLGLSSECWGPRR